MAKKKSSSEEVKMSLIGIDGNLAYSTSEVWAYYRLPEALYEFMSQELREGQAYRLNAALSQLVTKDDKSVECHLIVTSSPLNVEEWARDWRHRVAGWDVTEGFHNYVDETQDYLNQQSFRRKDVFLGVLVGKRGSKGSNEGKGQMQSLWSSINGFIDSAMGTSDHAISDGEIEYWRKKAHEITRIATTNNGLAANPISAAEIATIYKRSLYPAMPSPTVDDAEVETWGDGELSTLPQADVTNGRRFLRITQPGPNGQDMEGYRATLCFSNFPDNLHFPEQEPWIHSIARMGIPFDMYTRFTLEPSAKVRKAVGRKVAEIKDEAENAAASSGGTGNVPLALQERYQSANEIEFALNQNAEPWVYARHRIVVTADTEENLRDRVQAVISHYADMQIELTWPTGDQLRLLLESQPGDHVRVRSYLQRQSLSIISGGMPTANSAVGDRQVIDREGNPKGWVGPYIGYTTSRVVEPVFFSPHNLMMTHDLSPGILITGSPGSGKSFFASTLTCQLAAQGVWTLYIDPKGDSVQIQGLESDIGKMRVIDLSEGEDGILDPFSFDLGEGQRESVILEIIRLLAGGIPDTAFPIVGEVIDEVIMSPNPSLNKVVDLLMASETPSAQTIGSTLNFVRRLPYARLCFSAMGNREGIRVDDGLTVITMKNMTRPPAGKSPKDYTTDESLGATMMYLLMSFPRKLITHANKTKPKAVVIDEAWAVLGTDIGKSAIAELVRLGRSWNTACILVSQNGSDFDSEGLLNSINAHFAFRNNNPKEASEAVLRFELEDTSENRSVVTGLNNGECLMRDAEGRIARVQIAGWNRRWNNAFETNPERRKALDDAMANA